MTLCPLCGSIPGDDGICQTHTYSMGDDWAAQNRIYCDFFHRGIIPERLAIQEQTSGLFDHASAAFPNPPSSWPDDPSAPEEPETTSGDDS